MFSLRFTPLEVNDFFIVLWAISIYNKKINQLVGFICPCEEKQGRRDCS
ncbi:hypothetical protein BACI9J_110096 [Bacillus altitudinis]|nr:hypothetical protein BACI9J_110096 [Bacillus altitudinis]